ncbi:alpha/beta fold hydrolase [Vampirovibrio sp.]|uniref:alpha/beta fold hydrolase n=1 Tax=Vampirovibrio sp. TaxID=2717857 RepID=UPI0035948E54
MFEILSYTASDGAPLKYGRLYNPNQPDTGKALLFVPGLGGSVKGALHFLELLLPEYSPIYSPDLRGFGINPIQSPLLRADIIASDLEAFYQGVIAPAGHPHLALSGISLGGVLATLLATQHPERYTSLTLLAPAFKPHKRSFSVAYILRNVMSHLLLGPKARTCLPYGLEAVTGNATILNDPQYKGALNLVLTPGFLLSVRDLCNRAMKNISTLQLPCLMVVPGQDIVCDPDIMRQAYRKIPGSTPKHLLEYADFYHDVLFEAEHPRLAQETLKWLLSLDPPPSSGEASSP